MLLASPVIVCSQSVVLVNRTAKTLSRIASRFHLLVLRPKGAVCSMLEAASDVLFTPTSARSSLLVVPPRIKKQPELVRDTSLRMMHGSDCLRSEKQRSILACASSTMVALSTALVELRRLQAKSVWPSRLRDWAKVRTTGSYWVFSCQKQWWTSVLFSCLRLTRSCCMVAWLTTSLAQLTSIRQWTRENSLERPSCNTVTTSILMDATWTHLARWWSLLVSTTTISSTWASVPSQPWKRSSDVIWLSV